MSADFKEVEQLEEKDCEAIRAENDQPRPSTFEFERQAEQYYRYMVRTSKSTAKRRAWPAWGLPAEALLMAMQPGASAARMRKPPATRKHKKAE